VSCDAFETLEHFKIADTNASDWPEVFGKQRAPDAMGMEDGPCPTASSKAMQQSLGTAFGLIGECRFALLVAYHKVVGAQVPFIFAACGNQQPQRVPGNDGGIIARCAQRPTSRPKLVSGLPKPFDMLLIGL
jgi:hypothetical protein